MGLTWVDDIMPTCGADLTHNVVGHNSIAMPRAQRKILHVFMSEILEIFLEKVREFFPLNRPTIPDTYQSHLNLILFSLCIRIYIVD